MLKTRKNKKAVKEETIINGFDLIILDEKGRPYANPATKAIPVFREIFAKARRKSNQMHEKAQKEAFELILYIYYMIDIRSFAVQRFPAKKDDELRHKLVRETLEFPKDWYPDKETELAAEFYEKHQYEKSPSLRMLKTGFNALNKTIEYLENIDYSTKGYTPKIVMEYLESIQDQIGRLEKLKQEAIRDINLGGRPKGGGIINIFENPNLENIQNYERMPEEI